MRKNLLLMLMVLLVSVMSSHAQRTQNPDTAVVTKHEVTVKGKRFPYTATTGTQPVWNDKAKVIATVHYTYYERTDIQDKSTRPLVISFNGGPGSGSVWMHIAYTGPVILNIDDEGYPLQPYGIKENPYSILDVADIVFVDPINTGFSRIVDHETPRNQFFGIQADIRYLAEWINTFVGRNNRWQSPKYLIGESYGTTRVAGLAYELQNNHWMYLNGVILVSPTDLGLTRGPILDKALRWPYYAATAWYHKKLPADLQSKDLYDILPEIEKYTVDEVIPAIAKGGTLSAEEKDKVASTLSRFSGIPKKLILQHNFDITTNLFWKELLREEGFHIGRLDSRYLGIDMKEGGERPDYNAELTSWLHSFTPAINYYYRNHLGWKTDIKYNMFGPVNPWDRSNDNTGYNLRQAMAMNPFLKVMVQAGYYDGGTDYFNAKFNLWQMDPSGKLLHRTSFKGYRSGHMMYLRKPDLELANEDLREFIKNSIPAKDQPAKY